MGRKDWPDDWKVGNDAAWGCLMLLVAVVAGILLAVIIRNWPL